MKKTDQTVRDLIYLDFDKASSIWSQFEEGLVERTEVTDETGKDRAAGTTLRIPAIAEANLGVDYIQKRSTLQSKTLHHDVLNRVERHLESLGLVTDLSRQVSTHEASPDLIRATLEPRPYVRASIKTPTAYADWYRLPERFDRHPAPHSSPFRRYREPIARPRPVYVRRVVESCF